MTPHGSIPPYGTFRPTEPKVMGMGSSSFASRLLRVLRRESSPISTPHSEIWEKHHSVLKADVEHITHLGGHYLSSTRCCHLTRHCNCSKSHSTILSSLLLKDSGEHGNTSECWQISGYCLSSCLLPLMKASCHVVSCSCRGLCGKESVSLAESQ